MLVPFTRRPTTDNGKPTRLPADLAGGRRSRIVFACLRRFALSGDEASRCGKVEVERQHRIAQHHQIARAAAEFVSGDGEKGEVFTFNETARFRQVTES